MEYRIPIQLRPSLAEPSTSSRRTTSTAEKALTKTMNTATGTIGRELGKQISRGILGGI